MAQLPSITFYIPQRVMSVNQLPASADTYWHQFGGALTGGVYASTIQTYLRLKADGFPCELVGKLPSEGIVLTHRDFLPDTLTPSPRLLIVCLKMDRAPHPYAQLHVVLNPQDLDEEPIFLGDRSLFPRGRHFIPHWVQPGLIERDRSRGERFETIAFIGNEEQLAPELREASWQQQLADLNLNWQVIGHDNRDRWNDFSQIDAIVAVRTFNQDSHYQWKPALKLYNAWSAGVPAILGSESGYRLERRSDLDYLEVTSLNDGLAALKRLQSDPDLRQAMADHGRVRAQALSADTITKMWREFLTTEAIPAYDRWRCASSLQRSIFLSQRYFATASKRAAATGLTEELRHLSHLVGIAARLRNVKLTLKRFRSSKVVEEQQ